VRTAVTENPIAQPSFFSQPALHGASDTGQQEKIGHQVGAATNGDTGLGNFLHLADQRPKNRYE
jgi:hypothetical protein